MPPKRHLLKMTQLGELSLVDNPANQHASAVIAKRAPVTGGFRDRLTALGKRLLDAAIPPADMAGRNSRDREGCRELRRGVEPSKGLGKVQRD
jgi:hypothetical protein